MEYPWQSKAVDDVGKAVERLVYQRTDIQLLERIRCLRAKRHRKARVGKSEVENQ